MAKCLIAIAIHSDLRESGRAGHSAWSESGVGDAFRRAGRRPPTRSPSHVAAANVRQAGVRQASAVWGARPRLRRAERFWTRTTHNVRTLPGRPGRRRRPGRANRGRRRAAGHVRQNPCASGVAGAWRRTAAGGANRRAWDAQSAHVCRAGRRASCSRRVRQTGVLAGTPARGAKPPLPHAGAIPGALYALKHAPGTCGVMRAGASEPAREAYRATWQVLKPITTPWSGWPEGHAGGKLPVTVGPLPKGYSCRSYGSLHKSARTPSNRSFTHDRRNAVHGEKDRAQPRATLGVHEHHVSTPLVSTSAPA